MNHIFITTYPPKLTAISWGKNNCHEMAFGIQDRPLLNAAFGSSHGGHARALT